MKTIVKETLALTSLVLTLYTLFILAFALGAW